MTATSRTPSDSAPRLGVLVCSTRPNRIGPTIAEWVIARADTTAWEIDLIDLAEINLPFLNEPKQPSAGDYVLPTTQFWSRRVEALDALVIVLPEYNNSYPATIKNALDTLFAEWQGLPVGIVGYGWRSAGTATKHLTTVLKRLKTRQVEPVGLAFGTHVDEAAQILADHRDDVAAKEDEVARMYAALRELVDAPEE